MRYVPDKIVQFYESSPIWTRSLASTLYGTLKNRKENTRLFWQYLNELKESQWWSAEKLEELQCERLRKLIAHAATNVPYYEKLLTDYGIPPSHIQTPDDLKKLPTLSKETVRKQAKDLIARNAAVKQLRGESTSGTTGTPLTVWVDDRTYAYSKAVQWLQHSWARYTHQEWIGVLAGYKIAPHSRKKPPFWITNYSGKQIHFSTYHLNPAYLSYYVKKLLNSKIRYLLGYSSAIGFLARYINSTDQRIPLDAVFLSSEPILDWERDAISKAFKCQIYDHYGHAERVVAASSCENSDKLHANMEMGIIELIENKSDKDKFKIIGTSLINYVMPLIRYEVNDITSGFVNEKCSCGRNHILINPIETKMEDFVITPEGNRISASILTFPFKSPKGILASQIIQEDINFLILKIIADEHFTKEEETKLKENISSCVGKEMRIEIRRVKEIPRTKNGKFRFVISEISNKFEY